jgi:hypothetical protein
VTVSTSQAIPAPAQAASPATGPSPRLLKGAGPRKIRRHDSRHTTLSLIEKAGIPILVISRWCQVTPIGSRLAGRQAPSRVAEPEY